MGDSNERRGTEGGLAAALLGQALALHRSGRVGEAERLYRQALEGDPDNVEALHLLGVAALQQGRAAEAVERIGQAAKRRRRFRVRVSRAVPVSLAHDPRFPVPERR